MRGIDPHTLGPGLAGALLETPFFTPYRRVPPFTTSLPVAWGAAVLLQTSPSLRRAALFLH